MSPSATRSSHSGKSSKIGERKAGHRTAVARPARAVEKALRARKTEKTVRPKSKPAAHTASGEAKQKRVAKADKTKKSAKTAEARLPRARSAKAAVKEPRVAQAKPPVAGARRGRRPRADSTKEPLEILAPSSLAPSNEAGVEADLVEEYIEDDLALEEDALIVPDDIELDPIGIPLTLLDPELVDVPRPTPPKPKPKITRTERRPHTCAGCGGTFIWLSVDGLCFSCLKRKLSQRKREDEGFTTFTPEAEDDDES
jgi:hypothetical protein